LFSWAQILRISAVRRNYPCAPAAKTAGRAQELSATASPQGLARPLNESLESS